MQLVSLNLGNNQLNGTIPTTLGNLVNLTDLDLSSNAKLGGAIPPSLCDRSELVEPESDDEEEDDNVKADDDFLGDDATLFSIDCNGNITCPVGCCVVGNEFEICD